MLVSMPALVPLVILRGSGPEHGRAGPAGGAARCPDARPRRGRWCPLRSRGRDLGKALALAEASLDRLGVCNRLNLALVDRGADELLTALLAAVRRRRTWMCDGDVPGGEPLDRPHRLRVGGDPERVATVTVALVDGLDEARADRERGDLRAGRRHRHRGRPRPPIASWTAIAARPCSGTRRPGSPTGSSSPARPRPGSTSTAFRARADRSPTATVASAVPRRSGTGHRPGDGRRQVRLEPGRRSGRARPAAVLARRAAARSGASSRRGEPVCIVSSGAIALGLPRLGSRPPAAEHPQLQAASALGQARLQARLGRRRSRRRCHAAQVLLTAPTSATARPTSTPGARWTRSSSSAPCRS